MSLKQFNFQKLESALAEAVKEVQLSEAPVGVPWIGVDFDGTLAYFDEWKGAGYLGDPIPSMVARVRGWIARGTVVKIFTARASHDGSPERMALAQTSKVLIQNWCVKHIGSALEVTCSKDFNMITLWDDRCVQVITNSGQPALPIDQVIASLVPRTQYIVG